MNSILFRNSFVFDWSDVALASPGGDHPAHRHHRATGESRQEQRQRRLITASQGVLELLFFLSHGKFA